MEGKGKEGREGTRITHTGDRGKVSSLEERKSSKVDRKVRTSTKVRFPR